MKMSDERLAKLIAAASANIERMGQPTTPVEELHYFQRYENFWAAMVERDRRLYG